MGAIIRILMQGLRLAGPASIGYFFNDAATWIANVTGTSDKVRKEDGSGFKVWYIVAVFLALGVAVYIVLKAILGKRKVFMLSAAVLIIDHLAFGASHSMYVAAGLLFSVAGSATEAEPTTYLPEYIAFTIGTVPTNIKIEVLGSGVVFSLDGTGITNLNGIRLVGELPANTYVFRLSDGFIRKNATFTIVNADAAQLDVYGWSDSPGANYILHESGKAFGNQDNQVPPFLYAAFPSAAAADVFTLEWTNKQTRKVTSNNLTRLELQAYLAQHQEVVSTRYNVDNMAARITSLQFRPSADQSFYFTRPQAA